MKDRPPVEHKATYLSKSQLFAGLPAEQMAEFERQTAMTTCERGRVFFSPEDSPGTIYILKDGAVRLFRRDTEGRQLTVAILDAGSVFGESELLGQVHAGVYAEALDECLLCVVPTEQMRTLIRRYPDIGLNLLSHLGDRLRRSQELSEEMAYWSAEQRLARHIELLAERFGRPSLTGGTIISRPFTQAEIASMIGATRQTVSELMGELTRAGTISMRRRRIIVRNRDALQRLGQPRRP